MVELEVEVEEEHYLKARSEPLPIMLPRDGLRHADTLRVVEVERYQGPRTGRWMVLPVGPHPDAPGARAALWPPLAANHSPNAAARRMADPVPEPVAPPEPVPDATPAPFVPAPGWNPWWIQASQWIARTALAYMIPSRSSRRDA